jgi:hypothetical protein
MASRPCRNFSFLLLCLGVLISCGGRPSGYGVILWLDIEGLPEGVAFNEAGEPLREEGRVYPFYGESNLRNLYYLSPAKSDDLAIPRFAVRYFPSQKPAEDFAQTYLPYAPLLGEIMSNGLAVRASAQIGAERIYRLRQGQVVKILESLQVEAASGEEGETETETWYRVLTADGTEGFSAAQGLRVFDKNRLDQNQEGSGEDPALAAFLSSTYYPEEFKTMIQENRINLAVFSPRYGTFPLDKNRLQIITSEKTHTFQYDGIRPLGSGRYAFGNSGLEVFLDGPERAVLSWTEGGTPVQEVYYAIAGLDRIAQEEAQRQRQIYAELRRLGPLTSSAYGSLAFESDGGFYWEDFNRLKPGIIPAAAENMGTVDFRYYPDQDIRSRYRGVLSFKFRSAAERVNFLYTLSAQGLRMIYVPPSDIRNGLVTREDPSPTVMFFAPAQP